MPDAHAKAGRRAQPGSQSPSQTQAQSQSQSRPASDSGPSRRSAFEREAFDPAPYRAALVPIIREIEALPKVDEAALDRILRRHPRDGRGFFSRGQLIAGFRHFCKSEDFRQSEEAFARQVQMRPVRSQSGVTPLTLLTKPFPCPGRCVFCPNDVRMPKSYLSDEPGAQRAANNKFDPYLQTWNRLAAYRAIGHPTDKIELIVLGGTWSFYPEAYQIGFALRCFEAMNDFGSGVDRRGEVVPMEIDFEALPRQLDGRSHTLDIYNRTVSRLSSSSPSSDRSDDSVPLPEQGSWERLESAQRDNESASCRCVGFSVETRPDHVTPDEVLRIRRLGCTKVQIGIQSLSDEILEANQRGHDVDATRRAMALLRGAGFKLHAHWMPNLLGATPEGDILDYAKLFEDPAFRPDELKLYPCSLVESAELMKHYESGAWKPYDRDELLDVLSTAIARTPRWCRLTRVIRDISSDDIVAGNKLTNFREIAEAELTRRGDVMSDIRAREIRGQAFEEKELRLRTSEYDSSFSREIFLEYVTPDDRIVAFLRLSLPQASQEANEIAIAEVAESAMIREVHVYGSAVGLGDRDGERAQHRGLGRKLLEEASRRSAQAGYADLAVISAVGTRLYYRALGFADGALYQHRETSLS